MAVVLWNNGSYQRFVRLTPASFAKVKIFRKLCPKCRTHFSLHPEFLLKRQTYSLGLVTAWLWAFLQKNASSRCQKFYEEIGLEPKDSDSRLSWTDLLDQSKVRTRPGYQLFHYWSCLFSHRASFLLSALVQASCQHQTELDLSTPWPCSKRAYPLQAAWLHWLLIQRAQSYLPLDEKSAFQKFVRYLAQAPSHKVRRVRSRQQNYDVLIL